MGRPCARVAPGVAQDALKEGFYEAALITLVPLLPPTLTSEVVARVIGPGQQPPPRTLVARTVTQ